MRSRPLVRVLLGRSPLEPGEPFELDVVLGSRSETPTEHVDVSLVADVGVAIPQGKTYATRTREMMPRQMFRWNPGELKVGEYRQRFRFALPQGAPPSYRASAGWCRVSYTVEVHVAIPMWIDRHAYFSLPVAAQARAPQGNTQNITATHPNGPVAGAMYIEASVDAMQLAPGEELRGDVSFANVTSRVRRVTLALVATERTREPYAAVNTVARYATTLVSGAPLEGESYPFRFAIPRDLWPSFEAGSFVLTWVLEFRADVVLGSDIVLYIPIDLVRPPPGAELAPRSRRALPVGRQRLARLWTIVAQRVGLSYDEPSGTIIASRGPVAMTLARTSHEGTLGIVARYDYPHLGLDVHLGGAGVFDFARARHDLRDGNANKRFTVTGRENAQLDAFFARDLVSYLATAASVELDDDRTEIYAPGAASSAARLEAIARSALWMLELLAAAVQRIPPPVVMAAYLPAWRAFADATSGRLELGRVWIHDASLGGFRFEIGTVWEPGDATKPRGTIVRVPIEPPLERAPSVEDASLSAVAREALRTLAGEKGFHASETELGVFTDEMTTDPATLAPKIEAMTTVLRAMRGSVSAGPFR